MFRKKAKNNPEIQKAVAERDKVLVDALAAVKKVDELKDDLLRQYEEANGLDQEGGE